MNVAIIIPDRNDRPRFTEHCLKMMNNQSLKPAQIIHVNQKPESEKPDLSYRYRLGYSLVGKNIDLIALIENDDWYSETYLEDSVNFWIQLGKPDIIGRTITQYYNIAVKGYFNMNHTNRSSAMNTLLKPRLNISWPPNHEVYTDLHLWYNQPHLSKVIIDQPLNCLGIKHGIGLCGGKNHTTYLNRFVNKDVNFSYLASVVDDESLQFYKSLHGSLHS
jgi:hypothetical protein